MSVILFQNFFKKTALMGAAEGGHLEVTRLLLDRGCAADYKDVCWIVSLQYNNTYVNHVANQIGLMDIKYLIEFYKIDWYFTCLVVCLRKI